MGGCLLVMGLGLAGCQEREQLAARPFEIDIQGCESDLPANCMTTIEQRRRAIIRAILINNLTW